LLCTWLAATVLSSLPSTLHALSVDNDVTEATRAAGAMLISADSSLPQLFAAAVIVHSAISLFWASILTLILPHRRTIYWALAASAPIAVHIIAPMMFPEVARLPFWPRFGDHLVCGVQASVFALWRRWRRRRVRDSKTVQ